jgi:glycosyltransferase 2 family protein
VAGTASGSAPTPTTRRPLARIVRSPWTFQIVIAAALLALAAWQVDLGDLLHSFNHAAYGWLGVAFAIYFISRLVHAIEWQITLTKVGRAPFGGLFGATLVGTLVNAVIPASAGEAVKVQIVANRYGLSRTGLITGRGAESLVNALIMVMFIAISFALPAAGVASGWVLVLIAGGATTAFLFAAVSSNRMPARYPDWRAFRMLPPRLRAGVSKRWPRFYDGLELIRNPRLLLVAFALNIFGWLVDLAIIWSYGQAFHLDVSIGAYLSVTVAVAIITVFPITFGNVGTFEFALLRVLRLYGVSGEVALAFAVGTHVISSAFNIGLGLVAMWLMGIRPGELLRLQSNAEQDGDAAKAAASS